MSPRVLLSLLSMCGLFAAPATPLLYAQGTHLWNETSYNDWEKGVSNGVAIGSDGTLSPGFKTETVAQLHAADVWAVASDRAGDAFVATGSPAQVLRIAPDGKQTVLFTTKDLSVQALAVGPDGALYAATLPSGRVYRIPVGQAAPGKALDESSAKVVFDAAVTEGKPKYIWAMQFDRQGRLYLAAGAPGGVYRVDLKDGAAAKPELFFASDEPHVRSMLFAPNGDLFAGTDGSGLVYRIDASGKGFVVYEAAKREVTSLALGAQGQLYVAAVGEKGRNTSLPALPVAGAGAAPTSSITVTVVQPGSTQSVSNNAAIQDGSEVYVIPANAAEAPRRIIAAHEDVIYSLRATPDGVLAATGNRGRVYRIHDDGSFEDVAHADAAQVTGFADAPGNSLYLPAANSGKLLRMHLAPANDGTLLSEVFDSTEPSQWGRVEVTSGSAPSSYVFEARTGNIDNPARGWSDWKTVGPQDAALGQPGARFAQWRLTLKPGARVSTVGLNYLPANAAPEVDEILVATGTKVNATAMQPSYPQQTVLNFTSQGGAGVNIDNNNAAAPLSAYRDKSSITARWSAHDDNGDDLRFAVYFRGEGDAEWRLLKKDLTDRYLSFDAALLPDGPYRLRVVATDAPSHTAGAALTGERVSELFLVNAETPSVTGLTAVYGKNGLQVSATAAGAKAPIARAEYSLDAGPWQFVEPVGRISDSIVEKYDFAVPLPPGSHAGTHIVTLRAFDRFDNQGSARVSIP